MKYIKVKDMATGTVKWFSDAKGFGFIEPDEPGVDVFAHFSAIQMEGFKTLKQGSRVMYELCDGPKGPHAHDIVAAAPAEPAAMAEVAAEMPAIAAIATLCADTPSMLDAASHAPLNQPDAGSQSAALP